ncbi:MAG: 4'-phosphopantetheinyl transferase superfamily protein [Verrucomicrobiota bacterium]
MDDFSIFDDHESPYPLPSGQCWLLDVSRLAGSSSLPDMLTEKEMRRANAYKYQRDRDRCIVRTAWLRHRLARLIGVRPSDLKFEGGPWGKPTLVGLENAPYFNLSHSDDLVLLGMSSDFSVGVDIESVPGFTDWRELYQTILSPAEIAAFGDLRDQEKPFFLARGWTIKEAIVKLTGHGLNVGLSSIELDYSAESIAIRGLPKELYRTSCSLIHSWMPRDSFWAACVFGKSIRLGDPLPNL